MASRAIAASLMLGVASAATSVMYVEGVLDNSYDNATMLKAAHDIAQSGFDTIIFAFLHAADDGTLVYNNLPFDQVPIFKQAMNEIIKAPNSTVKRALISIGGAGADGTDYPHIGSHWESFVANATKILEEFKLDGFDLDEEDSWDNDVLVNITRLCGERGWLLSASPEVGEEDEFGPLIKSTLCGKAGLKCKNLTDGYSPFTFINIQTYGSDGPGAGGEVSNWVSTLQSYVPADQLQGMFFPGLETPGLSPAQLKQFTTGAIKASSKVNGVTSCGGSFIWDYRLLQFVQPTNGWTAAKYAAAINGANATETV